MRRRSCVHQTSIGSFGNNSLYASALYRDDCATLDDHQEAVTTIEDTARIARRVFGGAHPLTSAIEDDLRDARAVLAARKTRP